MKGLIALDIDGTVITRGEAIPEAVINYLRSLALNNWTFVFITGRTFQWAFPLLETLKMPYYFSVQNGAITLEMPKKKIINRRYLQRDILSIMEEICENEPSDFIIYSGCENLDRCYYRPKHFSKKLLDYVHARTAAFKETWIDVPSFETLALDQFASVKSFGNYESAGRMVEKIESRLGLHVPLIKDPFDASYYVAQATHPLVSKGQALKDLAAFISHKGPIIVAGDDNNDRSMLAVADIKVVMATAPEDMLENADVIAPAATDMGIIDGLQRALKKIYF